MVINLIQALEYKIYIWKKRKKLTNKNMTILSNNCNGAFILHDMGCPFNTPTINLYINAADFVKILKNPIHYFKIVPNEVWEDGIRWPIGQIDDVKIYFMHYNSFANARDKWVERTKRIDYNNLYVMMTERDGCSHEIMEEFDHLPYKHKVIFTHTKYPEIKSSFCISGFENEKQVGILSEWKEQFLRRRYLDDYDYITFLNEK